MTKFAIRKLISFPTFGYLSVELGSIFCFTSSIIFFHFAISSGFRFGIAKIMKSSVSAEIAEKFLKPITYRVPKFLVKNGLIKWSSKTRSTNHYSLQGQHQFASWIFLHFSYYLVFVFYFSLINAFVLHSFF